MDVRAGEHQPAILKPNERLVYSHAAHTVTVRPVDALLYKMERSGYLIYENVSFSHLMASLERKFNVTIHYNSQKYTNELPRDRAPIIHRRESVFPAFIGIRLVNFIYLYV